MWKSLSCKICNSGTNFLNIIYVEKLQSHGSVHCHVKFSVCGIYKECFNLRELTHL
jgi:hypothetical protein